MLRWFLCLFCLSLCGCFEKERPGNDPGKEGTDLDVQEAVCRHYLKQFDAAPDPRRVFYVSLDGQDPPAEFLKRLGDPARFRPASRRPKGKGEPVEVLLSVEAVQWNGPDNARIMGNVDVLSEDRKCGTPFPTEVIRKDGKWVVEIR